MTAIAPAVKRLDRDAEAGIMRRLFGAHEFGVLVATAAIFLYCALFVNNFLTSQNLLSVAQQIAFIGIIGTGMTLVVVVGEIDLSVGSQYGLLSVVMAYSLTEWSMPAGEAAVVVIALGACIGLVQGLVTTVFKVPSFVVTLAGLAILRGFALLLTASEPIVAPVSKQYHSLVGGSAVGSLAMQTVWMGGIMLAFGWMLSRTKFGYDVYATGGNMKAAVDAGIRANRIKVVCFGLTGALCGLAAVLLVGWLGSANPLTGNGFELNVIAAVVVGGASLSGGVGSVTGTLFGALVAGLIVNALVLLGVDGNWQQVATGGLILAAVLVNRLVATRQTAMR
ncbi:ABC transporter permease [Streptomyces sp. NBC_00873]|uniref:ABC transporter permease n=1 Tax=unclassified Streptomyces TaxID=2593676 RepID=UPI00386C8DBA|nr:ABC transporter permease [Streptomyces sp. NBC_00873]WTA41668.1 ABC transporter permease [Streptomyces sp. NBC_00842]